MTRAQREDASRPLWVAWQCQVPMEPPTETFPGIDVVDAYEIQLFNIRRHVDAGAAARGHKVRLVLHGAQEYGVVGAENLVEQTLAKKN